MKKFVFSSGLPRSGTTLLSAILNQNPRFSAEISGPLARFTRAIIQESESQGGYRFVCPPEKRIKLIRGLFENYYDDPTKQVFFNHNRGWTSLTPLIQTLYPGSKMIVCVREIQWILDSFEQLIAKNPMTQTTMFHAQEGASVYSRCRTLLQEDRTLGFAYNSLKQGLFSNERQNLCVVEYEAIAKAPKITMQRIYKFLEEPWFEHDFSNVEYSNDEFDADINLSGLHTIRRKVEYLPRRSILPPDIFHEYSQLNFWKTNYSDVSAGLTWIK